MPAKKRRIRDVHCEYPGCTSLMPRDTRRATPYCRLHVNAIVQRRPEVRAKIGAGRKAAHLQHIPPAYWDLYLSLADQAKAAERLAMVQRQIERDARA